MTLVINSKDYVGWRLSIGPTNTAFTHGIGFSGTTTVGDLTFVAAGDATFVARGVPELSTWVMMIIGFGLVGLHLRATALQPEPDRPRGGAAFRRRTADPARRHARPLAPAPRNGSAPSWGAFRQSSRWVRSMR